MLAPRALEGGSSERQHFLAVGRENSELGQIIIEGTLPKEVEAFNVSGVKK